jgi:hypothetical protein
MQPASPKMSRKQAKLFWNHLTNDQKIEFNKMMVKLGRKELMITNVIVDDNEQIQRIILENKNKPSKPVEPFAKHFHYEDSHD